MGPRKPPAWNLDLSQPRPKEVEKNLVDKKEGTKTKGEGTKKKVI